MIKQAIKAFTLTETLLCLAIIGVIALLTIPNLLAKYQEQVTVTKVKKFYNTINNATQLAIKENGTIDNWGIKNSTDLIKPLIKYFKIQKDCGMTLNSGCVPTATYRADGTLHANYDESTYMGGYYKLILADGSTMWSRWNDTNTCNPTCGTIWYDTTGKKGPNTVNIDVFTFRIEKDKINTYPDDCPQNLAFACYTAHVILNGNMNYLKN